MKMKIVFQVPMDGPKSHSKAVEIAASISGVESVKVVLQGEDKNQLVVTGEGVDARELWSLLRDELGFAMLISEEEKKKDLFKTCTSYIGGRTVMEKYASGLTESPDAREWHYAESIDLSHNELSNLPEEPVCPYLFQLYLDRNYKLRKIPPAFFTNMPLLQSLDLSDTSIMLLPKSLFELANLKNLRLENCKFLMKLPSEVGKLRRLETLAMEGTEIINLPIEIKELSLLIVLRVSLYGCLDHDWKSREMIPSGVISALSELEELYIDVNPDDKRWDACVERIAKEVYGLTKLKQFGLYFPRVELLSCLRTDQYQLKFKLIVGGHSKRIISRLPSNVEGYLNGDQHKYQKIKEKKGDQHKSLKYINGKKSGESGKSVPEIIKKVLRYSTTFHLDRHMTATTLTEFGIENMDRLRYCVVGECNEMRVIIDGNHVQNRRRTHVDESTGAKWFGFDLLDGLHIYYMKNLKSIWEGPKQNRCLYLLTSLTMSTCPELITIFTVGFLESLRNLKKLTVIDCPAIKSLVSREENDEPSAAKYYLPELKIISLHCVPNLVSISSDVRIAPKLELLSLYNCPKLKSLSIKEVSSKHLKITGETDWWKALETKEVPHNQLDGIFVPISEKDCMFLSGNY